MKKRMKKLVALMMAVLMVLSLVMVAPTGASKVQAASDIYFNPYSGTKFTYKPGDNYSQYYSVLSIVGCNKKSEITSVKSSNKDFKVEKKDGYLCVYFGDKAGKTTISCKVKGKTIKTSYQVVKYSNPVKTFKIGTKCYKSKFNSTDEFKNGAKFSNKKVSIKAASGWKITSVYVYNGSSSKTYRSINSSSWSKKLSLNKSGAYISVTLVNQSKKLGESLEYRIPY